jgi:hypothetical protein
MKEIVKLRSLVQIGQDSLSQEQQLVQQLQMQLDDLHVRLVTLQHSSIICWISKYLQVMGHELFSVHVVNC